MTALAGERGLKAQDIDLGSVTKSGMVDPAVADAAFALKDGEVSAPVQGQFGAVIVTVLKIEPEVVRSLAEVAPQLRNDIALERAKTQVQDIHDKIEDDRAGGSSLDEAAAKLKLPVITYDVVDRSGRDPNGKPVVNLPHGAEVISAAFASDVGVDNDPIEADGGYVWYDVAAITPAHERPLDEVKDEVEQRWRDDEIASRLKAKAADLLDKAKSGTPFDTLATTNGLKVDTANDLKRGGTSRRYFGQDDRHRLSYGKGRVRQRRRRYAHAMDRVPRHRRQNAESRPEFARRQEGRADGEATDWPRT